ncbi:MAG: hypothetical protein Kow0069_05790 [Promethearchaeota archaeon]
MKNFWFSIYHLYSASTRYSPRAVRAFARDVDDLLERDPDVGHVIMEDYYRELAWGEYARPWNERTLREFVRMLHDRGLKFLPYVDATELATHAPSFEKNGRAWGAKTRWGKVYAGYSSVLYPSVYFLPRHEFFLRLACPASGWADHLVEQARSVVEGFEADGLYVDRLDYRVPCHDASHGGAGTGADPEHFSRGLVPLFERLRAEAVESPGGRLLVMNDSCMDPDPIMGKLYRVADAVLSELLLADMNPWGLENVLATRWGDLAWKFRRVLRPVLSVLLPALYRRTPAMVDAARLLSIVARIRRAAGDPKKSVLLFSHRVGEETRRLQREMARRDRNLGVVHYFGPRPVAENE